MSRFLLLAFLLPLVGLSPVLADDFSGFRVPKHRVFSLLADVNGVANRYSSSSLPYSSSGNASSSTDKEWTLNGDVNAEGSWLYDSDPLRISTSGEISSDGNSRTNRQDYSGSTTGYRGKSYESQRIANEGWSLYSNVRGYLPQFPIGITGSVSARGGYSQHWSTSNSNSYEAANERYTFSSNDQSTADYGYSESISAGPGIGRVRDVSTVYDVDVFERRLRENGILARDLSHSARQKLIDLVYFEDQYAAVHDRPQKFFWQEVENILIADSAVSSTGMSAFDVYRLGEPYMGLSGDFSMSGFSPAKGYPGPRERGYNYARRGILRERGWFAGFLVYYSHNHFVVRDMTASRAFETDSGSVTTDHHSSSSSHSVGWAEHVTCGPQIEGHLPWGMNWQFDAVSSFQTQWDRGIHSWYWASTATAAWLVADRWLAFGRLDHSWDREHDWNGISYPYNYSSRFTEAWRVYGSAEVHYFIEDHATAYVVLSYSQGRQWETHVQSDNSKSFDNDWNSGFTARIGLTYRFSGFLHAPGIIPNSTLLPWGK